jgi:ferric-dicitrate binding protein FerR (iron transport regulator)
MAAGATLFPGDVVRLGEGSSAALQFGRSLVLVNSLTEFVVGPAGVTLLRGHVQVRAGAGESFAVSGPFFALNIGPSRDVVGLADIQLGGTHARVSTVAGVVKLSAAGSEVPYELHAGEAATLDVTPGNAATTGSLATSAPGATPQDGQGAANPSAGKVSSVAPQVQIDHASVTSIASTSTQVFWNDNLRSGPTGRARISLNDGSLLNLGSNSEMRVVQHDAKAQQTTLDLAVGRMRGQVVKLTRPGSKFEIRTPVGVAGLVGTDFSLFVTADYTELTVFSGIVRFTPLAAGAAANVNAGMTIRILRSGVVEGPSPSTPEEVQTAQSLTDVPKVPVQVASVAGAQVSAMPVVIVSVAAATAAIGIGAWRDTIDVISPQKP